MVDIQATKGKNPILIQVVSSVVCVIFFYLLSEFKLDIKESVIVALITIGFAILLKLVLKYMIFGIGLTSSKKSKLINIGYLCLIMKRFVFVLNVFIVISIFLTVLSIIGMFISGEAANTALAIILSLLMWVTTRRIIVDFVNNNEM